MNRKGGKFGDCVDITKENYTRSVYEEVYADIISYSMTVSVQALEFSTVLVCHCYIFTEIIVLVVWTILRLFVSL